MISSVVRTVLVYLAVVVAMRLMGKRQLGELQPSELVTTLLISNVASICIDEPDLPLSASLVPIFLITALEILNSTLVWFCPKYAQLLLGKPVTIIRNGEIQQNELAQLRITASEDVYKRQMQDQFAFRDAAVNTQRAADEVLFQKVEEGGILLGKDHWMFTKLFTVDDATKKQLDKNITAVSDFAANHPGKMCIRDSSGP